MKTTIACIIEGVIIFALGAVLFLFYQKNTEVNNYNITLLEQNERAESELALTKNEVEKLQKTVKEVGSDHLAETANLLVERNNLRADIKKIEEEKDKEIEKLNKEIEILRGQIEDKASILSATEAATTTPAKTGKNTASKKIDDTTLKKRHIVKKYDFMEEINWYNTERDCVSSVGDFESFTIQLYFGQTNDNALLLRLKTKLVNISLTPVNAKWMFYNKILIKGDNGKSVRITIKDSDKDTEIEQAEVFTALKEWSDSYVTDEAESLLEIAKSSKIYVKVYGAYDLEFEMTKDQTYAFKEIMQTYNSLK